MNYWRIFLFRLLLIFFLILSSAQINFFPFQHKPGPYSEFFVRGKNFRLQGEYKKSIQSFENSLDSGRKNNNKNEIIESLLNLGILYWNTGQLEKSDSLLKEALGIVDKLHLEGKRQQILSYNEIYRLYSAAKEHRSQGRLAKSIESFEKAVSLARKVGSREHEVKCLRQLSITYWKLSDLKKFYLLNKEALEIAREIRHKVEEGRSLNNMGIFFKKIDNYSQALNHYKDALQIARNAKNIREESICLTNMGNVYNEIGNYEKALEYLTKALQIDRKLREDVYVSKDLNNIGETFRSKGLLSNRKENFYKALKYFEDSLALTRKAGEKKTEIQVLNNMGTVYTDLDNYPEALKYFNLGLKKAEEIQDTEAISMILNNIGIVYSNQGNYEYSTRYYQKAIDLALGIKGGQILWEAYFEMANAYKKQKKYQKALKNYEKSISVIEDIRSKIKLEELKARYLGTDKRIEVYLNMIDLLVRLHESAPEMDYNIQAFNYLERAKARAFLDSLEVSEVNISQGIDQKLLNQERELMKDISKLYIKLLAPGLTPRQHRELNEQLKIFEDRLETLKREIRTTSPAYADLKYPQIITLQEAQKKLIDRKTAFFEYCIGKENSYAFVLTKKELKIFPIPRAEEIQKMVKKHLKEISDKENRYFNKGYALYSMLVSPGLNANYEKIVFIPDDILHFLPFETLLTQKNKKKWLIEDYTITYASSLSSLREIIKRKKLKKQKRSKDILAFGDPFFSVFESESNGEDYFQSYFSSKAFNFFRLEYSSPEINGIASLFANKKRSIFTREEATEERLKKLNLSDYKIIHFATHGLIDDKRPARSSIVLSLNNNSSEDGFLQMREIFNLKLNSDLVALSACQTGLGQFIKGEGIEGLNRAFFYAGASSVLMTLWAVNDQASSQLMKRFYTHLRSSESIMNALRKTKLEMITSDALSHPFYWAGFIVTGKTDKTVFPSSMEKWIFLVLFLVIATAGFIAFRVLTGKKPSPSKKI